MSLENNQVADQATNNISPSSFQSDAPVSEDVSNKQSEDTDALLKLGDREYKSMDDVAKHLEHATSHIQKLENENKQLRDNDQRIKQELESKKTLDDVLERIEAVEGSSSYSTQSNAESNSIDPDYLINKTKAQLKAELEAEKIKESRDRNFLEVSERLTDLYKDKADTIVKSKARELDMSFDDAIELAHSNKALFTKIFIDENKQKDTQPTSSNYNSSALLHDQIGRNKEGKVKNYMKDLSAKERVSVYSKALQARLNQNM